MKDIIQKDLNKNKFIFVKFGLYFTVLVLVAIIIILTILKIENKSILFHVINYYFVTTQPN